MDTPRSGARFAVLCIDHPAVQQMIPRLSDRRIITYGFSPQADVRADRVTPDKLGSTFEVSVTDRARSRLHISQRGLGLRSIGRIEEQGHTSRSGHHLTQEF